MCGGVVFQTASAPHFLPLWCQIVIPTLSQTTITELWFLLKTRPKTMWHNTGLCMQSFWWISVPFIPSKGWKLILKSWIRYYSTEVRPQHGNTTHPGSECTNCEWYSVKQRRACLLCCKRKKKSMVCHWLFGICKRLTGLKRLMTLGSCQLPLWLKWLS